ncbi:hypothetical protein AVEN_245416-1 [Araneus ventricosus]|uniref:Endonuclease/exonuclease/phosphatase domain-containing protein n=1 Tax=Araneus ventricosus TaxID=182803 RepID=A0A4Y2LE37_ARAVE|nr:hypothetical protein AVEN_245416-1 [Araneus ventricosus]
MLRENRARSQSEKSHKLKQAKRGLSQKDLPTKLKKSAHHNSVALGLADKGIVHKDLPSIFGGVPQVPDLHPHLKDEPSTPLTLHTSLQAVDVQDHARTLVTVCSVYLPPHDVISEQDLDALVDQLPAPFLLLGDFNGHSTLWGSDVTNSRGRQIERIISKNCLCLLNNDEKTYFHEPKRTFHSLYLAICSPTLLLFLHFTVGSDLCNSDHFPIIVSYADSSGAIQYPPRYLFQRADWGNFMQLADITESMVSTADITEAVQNVVNCLVNAANNTIPKCSQRLRKFRRP